MDTDNQGIMNFRPFTRWVFDFGLDQIPFHSVSVYIRAIRGKIQLLNTADETLGRFSHGWAMSDGGHGIVVMGIGRP
jgi:hypothetical protein